MAFVPLTEPPASSGGEERWYLVRRSELLVGDDRAGPVGPTGPVGLPTDTEPIFLGIAGGTRCWAQGVSGEADAPAGDRWVPLLALGSELATWEWAVAGRAVQLVEWQRTSRF